MFCLAFNVKKFDFNDLLAFKSAKQNSLARGNKFLMLGYKRRQ